MTIKVEIRAKVIEMFQEGKKGRNQIARELSLSQGSVSNILKEWKKGENNQSTTADTATVIATKSVDEITQPSQIASISYD